MASSTITGPASIATPRAIYAPLVDIKSTWSGSWQYKPELEFVSASLSSGADDLGACQIQRRYGSIKQQYETSHSTKTPMRIDGYWVRIRVLSAQGMQTLWVGKISKEPRIIFGSDVARTGQQQWVAYDARQILRKTPVSRSFWEEDGSELDIGWVPSFNRRNRRNTLVGNRSAEKLGGVYLYGGTEIWTHFDAAEYVLKKFADVSGGPEWTLGGQKELLKDIKDVVELGATQYVADILRALIPPNLGIDFKLIPSESGFTVHVFALVADDVSFEGASLPRNPNTVRIQAGETHDMPQVSVTKSSDQRFGKIRVRGQRMVLCTSLFGEEASEEDATLVPRWSDALETEYKEGTGNPHDKAEAHDQARKADKFRPVFSIYGAPDDKGFPAPELSASGEIEGGEQDYQKKVRETLQYLPLREGWDYTQNPPVDENPEGFQADLLEPLLWVRDEKARHYVLGDQYWLRAEEEDIGVMAKFDDWGIQLSVSPNHLLALNHFDYDAVKDTETEPMYDYEKFVATIALRADQRLELSYDVPGGDDTVKDIYVPSAELWVLMPNTVVSVDSWEEGLLKSPDEHITLRNDNDYLAFVMAGAIARYAKDRARASLTIKGLQPWGELVGHILTVVDDAGDTEQIHAPITSVKWTSGDNPQTIVSAGYS